MVQEHYDRLAENYERFWFYRPDYVDWMADLIMTSVRPKQGARIVDVGSGTGLFLRRLVREIATTDTPILCVDPSQPMLDRLPPDPRLRPVQATAEQIASGEMGLPYERLDAVIFKEAIHHVVDIATTLKNLAGRLAPGGVILIVTLPPRLDYPLFDAALDRFAAGQPDPDDIAAAMAEGGLDVDVTTNDFRVTIEQESWLSLVAGRPMSVLSTFTDEELEEGMREIRAKFPEQTLTYLDRFAFVRGVKPA